MIDIQKNGKMPFVTASNSGQYFSQSMIQSWEMILMPTSQMQLLNEISAGHDGPQIPPAKLAYFQERLRDHVFDFIIGLFLREQKNGLNKAKLGRRIGKRAEVVESPAWWTKQFDT